MKFKKSLIVILFVFALLGRATISQAGILVYFYPVMMDGSDEDIIMTAIYAWPLGIALGATGIALVTTGSHTAGGILIGLDENQESGFSKIQRSLSEQFPEVQDQNAYRMLAKEIETRILASPNRRDESTGQVYRYVSIPENKLIEILSPTGLLESSRADHLIQTLSK